MNNEQIMKELLSYNAVRIEDKAQKNVIVESLELLDISHSISYCAGRYEISLLGKKKVQEEGVDLTDIPEEVIVETSGEPRIEDLHAYPEEVQVEETRGDNQFFEPSKKLAIPSNWLKPVMTLKDSGIEEQKSVDTAIFKAPSFLSEKESRLKLGDRVMVYVPDIPTHHKRIAEVVKLLDDKQKVHVQFERGEIFQLAKGSVTKVNERV